MIKGVFLITSFLFCIHLSWSKLEIYPFETFSKSRGVHEIPAAKSCVSMETYERGLNILQGSRTWFKKKQNQDSYQNSDFVPRELSNNKKGKVWKIKNSIGHFFSSIPNKYIDLLYNLGQGNKKNLGTFSTDPRVVHYDSATTKHIALTSWKRSPYANKFNDPYWQKQWYLQDYRTADGPVVDLNVVPVYEMGYTGKGVIVAIVDDGVTHNHPDLKANHDKFLSYDACTELPGSEPSRSMLFWKDSHGTNCAGVVGMVAGNEICGVGIAHEAKIIGVKIFYKYETTEEMYATGLLHRYDIVDIYSNSWGALDHPLHVCILAKLIASAYKRGARDGRSGKGVIYVQSVGNGGSLGDISCATDCFINTPEVIGIGAADQYGKRSDFSERCTAVFAVTYSGSTYTGIVGGPEGIVALTSGKGCTSSFSGTSAATPLASGIIALVLQANPQLTYRDVMHLIAMTSEVAPLADNPDTWYLNGRGFWVSNDFGFGLMNAKNLVKMADKNSWKRVPKKSICKVKVTQTNVILINRHKRARMSFNTAACESSENLAIRYLEHVEVAPKVTFQKRGAIALYLQSPSGTLSHLLEYRPRDISSITLNGTNIMSVHHWGEDPRGEWKIQVKIDPTYKDSRIGYVYGFDITLHGTYEMPDHYKSPRIYASFTTPDGKASYDGTKNMS